ncbi:MAG: hypothetical protein ACP5UA_13700 [Candidatus Hydrogenedens sp.]
MNFRNMAIYSSTFVILFAFLYGCVNEEKIEIVQKRMVSSTEKPIIPLPAPQRLRLLPTDLDNRGQLDTGSLSGISPEEITTKKEEQDTGNSGMKPDMRNTSLAEGGFGKLELEWVTPAGWQEDTNKPMRVVSFNTGDNSTWECYISVLMSQAGGVEANLKRWANQMGKRDIDTQTIEQLTDVTILGKQCKLLDITGNYEDMQGITHENYRLLGAVCSLGNQTLFVKMIGPEKEVALQKDNFIKLCNSLTLKN